MIVEEGVLDGRVRYEHNVLSIEAQVGPSRRRGSGRKGQGAGLGLAEEEAGEEEVEDDEEDEVPSGRG